MQAVNEKTMIQEWLQREPCHVCGGIGTCSLTGSARYSAPLQLETRCTGCGLTRWATLASLWEVQPIWVDWFD
jgi:hypothetical protein